MSNRCPECGVPLDEIPFNECRHHEAYFADEQDALRRKLSARHISEKIRESDDFEELRDHLADWLQEQDA